MRFPAARLTRMGAPVVVARSTTTASAIAAAVNLGADDWDQTIGGKHVVKMVDGRSRCPRTGAGTTRWA